MAIKNKVNYKYTIRTTLCISGLAAITQSRIHEGKLHCFAESFFNYQEDFTQLIVDFYENSILLNNLFPHILRQRLVIFLKGGTLRINPSKPVCRPNVKSFSRTESISFTFNPFLSFRSLLSFWSS